MPVNVRRFAWLWWASILLAFADALLLPAPSPSELRLGMTRSTQIGIIVGAEAIWIAVQLPFFWLTISRRKNWARWLMFVSFVAGTGFSVFVSFVPPTPPPGVDPFWIHMPFFGIVVGWLSFFAGAAAFYFLFTGDARTWFRGAVPN
jgi:hypothetical protein